MEQPPAQPAPKAPKSTRMIVEIALYALLGLLFLAFVLLQVNANRKYAVELTEELEGRSFVFSQWDSSISGMLHTRKYTVMLLGDGIATRVYLDSVKDMYADETLENSSRSQLLETSTDYEEAANWSVRVSIFNRITVKVGENVLVVHQDEFGKIDYLSDGYKIYYHRPTFD